MWEENETAVRAFLRVRTQWRPGGMGGAIGLDYPAVEGVLRRMKIEDDDRVFEAIQAMEAAILNEWSRQARIDKGRRR